VRATDRSRVATRACCPSACTHLGRARCLDACSRHVSVDIARLVHACVAQCSCGKCMLRSPLKIMCSLHLIRSPILGSKMLTIALALTTACGYCQGGRPAWLLDVGCIAQGQGPRAPLLHISQVHPTITGFSGLFCWVREPKKQQTGTRYPKMCSEIQQKGSANAPCRLSSMGRSWTPSCEGSVTAIRQQQLAPRLDKRSNSSSALTAWCLAPAPPIRLPVPEL
jgi:hypothetical protein